MAAGSRRHLSYVAEATKGVTPGTPSMKPIRNTGGNGIQLARSKLASGEYRTDRQISDMRLGNNKVSLPIPFELSYASYDDLLAALLFGAWAVAYNLTGQTVSVNSTTKKFSRASGSWITDGVKVGDPIVTTGFEDAGNNGTFEVTAVSALEITCANATGLVTVSGDTGVTVTTTAQVLKAGTTGYSFTIEEGFNDIAQYRNAKGCVGDSLSLKIAPDSIITGEMGFVGMSASAFSGSSLGTPSTPEVTTPMDTFSGTITEGGAAAVITGLSLQVNNAAAGKPVVFSRDAADVAVGRCTVTGRVSLYFEDATMRNKFINETESAIEMALEDPDGNRIIITIPRVKYASDGQGTTENDVTLDMEFQGLYDSASATSLILRKQAAVA